MYSRASACRVTWATAQITVRNLRIRGIDVEEGLLLVEGAVPGAREGYVLISKAKAPPRERRGFAGAFETRDALKASKKAAPSKKEIVLGGFGSR